MKILFFSASSSNESIKPILIHDHSSSHHQHHVHVEDESHHETDDQSLTPEERG
jgi:hypothetical protein